MGSFRYTPPRESDTRHRAARSSAAREALPRETPTEVPTPEPKLAIPSIPTRRLKNIEPVFALDEVMYISFQSKLYAIPPVSYKLGERLLDLHVRTVTAMKEIAISGSRERTVEFYRLLDRLKIVLWKHMRPTPKWRRWLRRFGLLRNPLRKASEQDLMRLTDFFLKCRMKSSVHAMSGLEEIDIIQSLTS